MHIAFRHAVFSLLVTLSICCHAQQPLRGPAAGVTESGSTGIVNPRNSTYGARGNGRTDDTAALTAALAAARSQHTLLYLPAGDYRTTASLDFTGVDAVGAGREHSVIRLEGAVQQNAIISRGNTSIRSLGVHGGWDGRTGGLTGAGIAILSDPTAKPPYFGYDVRLDDISVQYSKQDCIFIEQGGYESLHNVKCNAAGQNGLHLESGKTRGFATTTVNVDGLSIFSDVAGYAVLIRDGQTISFSGRTVMENTSGIRLAGNDGRTLKLAGIHQENTRGGKFLTAVDSSGIGLTLSDNFLAGSPIVPESANELAHWFNISVDGNALAGTYGTGAPQVIRHWNAPDAEPLEVLSGGWRFAPEGPTTIGLQPHRPNAAWSARLAGNWVTGDTTAKIAHEILITSTHPLVRVGPTVFRFGVSSDGVLQATVQASAGQRGPFEFQGLIEFVVDRQHSEDGDVSLETPANTHLGGARIDALAGKGTAQVCATADGTLVRCPR